MRTSAVKVAGRGLQARKLGLPGPHWSPLRGRAGERHLVLWGRIGEQTPQRTLRVCQTNLRTRAEFQKRISVPVRSFKNESPYPCGVSFLARMPRDCARPAHQHPKRHAGTPFSPLVPCLSASLSRPHALSHSVFSRAFALLPVHPTRREPAEATTLAAAPAPQQPPPLRRLHSSSRRFFIPTARAAALVGQLSPPRF